MACKLIKVLGSNTLHYHDFHFLEGGVFEDADRIDQIVSSERPAGKHNQDFHNLIKVFKIHWHPLYRTGPAQMALVTSDMTQTRINQQP